MLYQTIDNNVVTILHSKYGVVGEVGLGMEGWSCLQRRRSHSLSRGTRLGKPVNVTGRGKWGNGRYFRGRHSSRKN